MEPDMLPHAARWEPPKAPISGSTGEHRMTKRMEVRRRRLARCRSTAPPTRKGASMDDETNQDATPDQAAPTGPSATRILPEAGGGTPNGGPKGLQTEAVQLPGPVGRGNDLDEWY